MKATRKKWCILLAVLIAAVFLCMTLADYIQRDGGAVTVTEGVLESDAGRIPYKLYTPASFYFTATRMITKPVPLMPSSWPGAARSSWQLMNTVTAQPRPACWSAATSITRSP